MPFKHTHTSNHPAFIQFGVWIEEKIAEAQAVGDTAEVEKINAALAAKQAVSSNVGILDTEQRFDGVSYTYDSDMPTAEEFDFYFNQWVTEFDVNIVTEEI